MDVLDSKGYQVFYGPKVVTLAIVLKPDINPEKFSSGEQKVVSDQPSIS